ncbi:MAG: hypothetical protein PHN74_02240, partial [Candidatus Pacebacteria bacterium]|nr:hypothetical protein [Candidatus Paceibacterota bacterium]
MPNKKILSTFIIGAFVLLPLFVIFAVDGSGTNTVSPNFTDPGSTGGTYDFIYTASETMDSGEIKITVPSGWSAPQGTNGVSGYTTVFSTGTIADVENSLNSATDWATTTHMALSVDTSDKQEGTGSLLNTINYLAAANEQWYFNYSAAKSWGAAANSTNGQRVGMWIKSSVNTASGDLSWQDDNTASLASPEDTLAIPALTANTWTYTSVTLGAARTSQRSYGLRYTTDIGAATIKLDSASVLFDAADVTTNWVGDTNITVGAVGSGQEGSNSIRCTYAAAAGTGTSGECYRTSAALTVLPGTTVSFWVRSSIALNANDFAWVDDDSAALASPTDVINMPAISANTWTYVTLAIPGLGTKTIRSYGLRQVVDKGAMTIDIDAIGSIIDAGDAITGWSAPSSGVQAVSTDTTVFHEGAASIKNIISASAASGDKWYLPLGSTENWSGYTTVGFWIRSTVATAAGNLKFEYSSASDLSSPIASINIGALAANTWTYQKLTLTGTRTSINSYGINYSTDIGATTINLDDILLGPGSLTFPGGGVIDARIFSLANTQTITVAYGSGGGSSGVTAPSTAQISTFTTQSRISDSGILTNIGISPTISVNNPAPTTTDIFPASKTIGDSQFVITVDGTNFVSSSTVRFNGSNRATTFVNSTQLTATILSTDLLNATSSAYITVFSPTPGGGVSNAQTFTIYNPTPTTTSISPTSKNTGDSQFTLTVNGTNFVSGAVVKFNGLNRTTTFVNSTQLTAIIPASDIITAGNYFITVANPSPVLAESNAQTLTVYQLDGTGTNTVSPSTTNVNSTGDTFTFTFTSANQMDTGAITLTAPSGFSAPQGNSGTAGYTTITSSSGTIADVEDNMNSVT